MVEGESGKLKKWSMEKLTQNIVGLNTNRDVLPEELIPQKEREIKDQIGLYGWSSASDMLKDVNARQKAMGQSKFMKKDFNGFF